jgi:hypothetical protein
MTGPEPLITASARTLKKGGRWFVLGGVVAGLTIGGLLAVNSVEIVAAFTPMTREELLQVNAVTSRLALVAAAAGLIGFIGLLLDVIYSGDSPWVDLAVRTIALAAGATAFVAAWTALPGPMHAATTFWGIFIVSGITAVAMLIVGSVKFWRLSNRKAELVLE